MGWTVIRLAFRFVLLTILFASNANAYTGRVAKPASVESVKQVFRLSGLDKVLIANIRKGMEIGNRERPDLYVDIDIYLAFVTPETIADHFAPIYAGYLSADYADKLIAAYQTPAGRQAARLMVIQASSGRDAAKAEFAKLSPSSKKAVNELERSVVNTSLLNARDKSFDTVKAAFHEWSLAELNARKAQINRELAAIIEEDIKELEAHETAPDQPVDEMPLPEKLSARTGVRYFDDEAFSLYISCRQNIELNRQMRRSMQGLEVDDILKPEFLSSRDGIEAANLRVLTLDGVLDNYDQISQRILDNYNKNIERINMPAEERKRLEDGNAKVFATMMDEQIRENESRRTMIELLKRTIALCESHLDKITYKDGKLLFYEDSTLSAYKSLIAQINRQVEDLNKSISEARARRKAEAEKMKGA